MHVNAPEITWAETKLFWECLEPGAIKGKLPVGPQRKSHYATSSHRPGVFKMSSELTRHHPRNTHKPHLSCSVYRALTKDLLQEKVQQLCAAVAAAGLRIPGSLGKDGSEHKCYSAKVSPSRSGIFWYQCSLLEEVSATELQVLAWGQVFLCGVCKFSSCPLFCPKTCTSD